MSSPDPNNSADGGRFIPPTNRARTLILCFDGTGDQFDNDNSNIVQFFTMLKKGDNMTQMVYYQAGIGTYVPKSTPMAATVSKTLDEMIAWNLGQHVRDGYEFVMQNYHAGDKICIFGFSRGAYTARALAGMIHKVGLLPVCNHQQVPFAYSMFKRDDEAGWAQSTAFKKAFSIDVDIEFMGVFDTVVSVGLWPRTLPFTASNSSVHTFRHAVSLDERRSKFKANLYHIDKYPKPSAPRASEHEALPRSSENTIVEPHNSGKPLSQKQLQRKYNDPSKPTDVLEVWFSGCHCDVGGGSVANGTPNSLARIPLRWMIRQCFLADTGIIFDVEGLKLAGLDPASLYPIVRPRTPPSAIPLLGDDPAQYAPALARAKAAYDARAAAALSRAVLPHDTILPVPDEDAEDMLDLIAPVYDQLSIAKHWWILELWPIRHHHQHGDSAWFGRYSSNLGHGRDIPSREHKGGINIHRSVCVLVFLRGGAGS
ncbi:hypothetical protein PLICRDRAFT_96153 [Plicaturopsis crispa FD-325 SS-3]|nr:hypothetical protein PLICRDRAFT_96153 [Plicaturopsis crispa FD-325 SS-3]